MAAADPFTALFPADAYARQLAAGARPDGRPGGAAGVRPLTLTLGAGGGGADGSALVRVGRATVLACVRLELTAPPLTSPDAGGVFVFTADAPPLAAADARPGRPPPRFDGVAAWVWGVLASSGAIDGADLKLAASEPDQPPPPGLALAARVDLTILDADGGEAAAALLAAAAALADTRVPCVSVDEGGAVTRGGGGGTAAAPLAGPRVAGLLRCLPAAATLALVGPHTVVDPDAGEVGLADALVTVAVDGGGAIVAVDAPGVTPAATRGALVPPSVLLAAAGAARARREEAEAALVGALAGRAG